MAGRIHYFGVQRLNSIGAMFQFQGGSSDEDNERLFADLVKKKYLAIGENGRITYPEP